jgi:hypothetical protein
LPGIICENKPAAAAERSEQSSFLFLGPDHEMIDLWSPWNGRAKKRNCVSALTTCLLFLFSLISWTGQRPPLCGNSMLVQDLKEKESRKRQAVTCAH